MNDTPIHLPRKVIKTEVELFQDQLDGLCALIHFCHGLSNGDSGQVPGHFELVMHYRALNSAIAQYSANTGDKS